jgi:hypothetical protein
MGNKSSFGIKLVRYVPYTYDSSKYIYQNVTYARRRYDKTRIGSDSPMYLSKIKQGISATNKLVASAEKVKLQPGFLCGQALDGTAAFKKEVFKNTTINIVAADIVNQPYPQDIYPALRNNAKNDAAIRIRKKIYEQVSTWSGPQFLGELRDTIHQLKHPAEAALSYAHQYFRDVKLKARRNGKKYGGRDKVPKAIAGSWLEFQFGLAPLVSDIGNILNATNVFIENKRIMRLSAFGVDESAITLKRSNIPQGNYYASLMNNKITLAKHIYTVGIKRQTSSDRTLNFMLGNQSRMQALNTSFDLVVGSGGFDASQIPSTIWELMPLSVFVDYFSNIGDVLQTAMVSLSDVAWTNSTAILLATERLSDFQIQTDASWFYRPDLSQSPVVEISKKWVDRDSSAVVIPQLRFSLPGSPKRLANLGAFLTLLTS